MFGKNPVRRQDLAENGHQLWVQEVFPTLQGEGPFAGTPAVFVRLAGCNLRCFFCDTDFESSTWNPTLDDLCKAIAEKRELAGGGRISLIVLTGGEPFRQNLYPLIRHLVQLDCAVQVETAGTLWWPWIPHVFPTYQSIAFRTHSEPGPDSGCSIVCSPKTGGLNRQLLPYIHYLKYIVRAGHLHTDGLPKGSTQDPGSDGLLYRQNEAQVLPLPPSRIYLQPMDEQTDVVATQANWKAARDSCLRHGYRLSLQLHKILGLP